LDKAVVKLSIREFLHSFSFKRKSAPGSKDFMSLTGLLGLIVVLGVVFSGAREGLIENFSDSLLGKISGVGVPLWVTSHPENAINKGISRKVEQLFRKTKSQKQDGMLDIEQLELFPYIFLEHSDPIVRLPSDDIWQKASKSDKQDFEGWAIAENDPLRVWSEAVEKNKAVEQSKAPELTVYINKNLFLPRFNLEKYVAALRGFIPVQELPDQQQAIDSLENIWLRVWVQDHFELVKFKVTWLDSFPALQKLVYLFPLETYQASILSRRTPFRFAPEGMGDKIARVASIDVLDLDLVEESELKTKSGDKRLDIFAKCLDTEVEFFDGSVAEFPQFIVPRSLEQLKSCETIASLPKPIEIDIQTTTSSSYAYSTEHYMTLPCSEVNLCIEDEKGHMNWQQEAEIDMYEFFSGANVYVENRIELAKAKDLLLGLRLDENQVFYFNPVYQDAILRFSYLTRTLDWIQIPLVIVYLVFVIALLWVQLSTLVNHRLNNYGIMLAKGMYWYQVKIVLHIQIFACTLVGAATIGGLTEIVGKYVFNQAFINSSVANLGRMSMGIQDFTLLPVQLGTFINIILLTVLLAMIVLEVLLRKMPLNKKTNPMDLL